MHQETHHIFKVSPSRRGGEFDLFQKPKFNSSGDQYQGPIQKVGRSISNLTGSMNASAFRPSGNANDITLRKVQALGGADPAKATMNTLNPDNMLGKKTLTTKSQMNLFQNRYEYISDPYDRKDEYKKLDYQNHRDKILNPIKPLPHNSRNDGLFSSPKGQQTSPAGSRIDKSQEKLKAPPMYGPFRPNNPAKIGYNKTINPHPKYYEELENQREDPNWLKERFLKKQREEKVWIPNTFEWSKPCISIAQHPKNQSINTSYI